MVEWRPIAQGCYAVSSDGQVFRVTANRGARPRLMSVFPGGSGKYKRVTLWVSGKPSTVYVHHLVAEAFIGPRPMDKEVNHIDANPANNCVENLEYVTSKENKEHAKLLRLIPSGESHVFADLKEEDVYAMRVLSKAGFSSYYIAGLFQMSPPYVNRVVTCRARRYDEPKVK